MWTSWKLGRVAGIDIYLHSTFLLLVIWILAEGGDLLRLGLVAAVFACVLLHELGHALTARQFGIETEDITLYPIGGVARLQRIPRSPGAEIVIALAGPAVNVAIVGGLAALGALGVARGPAAEFGLILLFANMLLAGFNLIPAFPMDGGRVFRALLSPWLGRLPATAIAAGVGRFLAVAFGLFCVWNALWPQVALAVFIYLAAGAELAAVRYEESRRRYDGGDQGHNVAPPGYHWVSRGPGVWQLVPIRVTWNDRG
jgi:Zn-dependent protease